MSASVGCVVGVDVMESLLLPVNAAVGVHLLRLNSAQTSLQDKQLAARLSQALMWADGYVVAWPM